MPPGWNHHGITVQNVVGSAIIAVVASIVALFVFFVLRAAWTNSWWKRAFCAIILAGAVFGIHWTASIGTQYRLKQDDYSLSHSISPHLTVIVVIVLSITACFILFAFAHIVLASATFDMHGRLLVTPEGILPNQKVTASYVAQSLNEEFGVSHPVFQWIFRSTRNWSSISSLLPGMRNHLYHASAQRGSRSASKAEVNPSSDEAENTDDYSIIFRELFCIAAADLAEQLNEPLGNVGILFDEILGTGHKTSKLKARLNSPESTMDLESGGMTTSSLGRGQLLFLVRRANRREAEHLAASGYRFAEIQNVAHIIARSMQINCNDFQGRLASMHDYSSETNVQKPGVHLACFASRASVRGGFDVLIRKDARNQLPTMQLPIDSLNSGQVAYLSQLDRSSVTACLKFLKVKLASSEITKREQSFATILYDALVALNEEINDPFFADALLIGEPISAPCYRSGEYGKTARATLIAFRIIVPIQFRAQGLKLGFAPLGFFRTQQYVYRNSPDHARFARAIHKEFGPILSKRRFSVKENAKGLKSATPLGKFQRRLKKNARGPLGVSTPAAAPKAHTKSSGLKLWNRQSGGESQTSPKATLGSTSEIQLVETQTFGGVMVSQEVSVDVRDFEELSRQGRADDKFSGIDIVRIQPTQMGTTSEATKEVADSETYVDRLLSVCIATRR
ncbi:hypothetical protein DL98DRAFT_661172 [Cadophora sp. DSE1049]|nr:hypothetical protein DL98DRAFT_661172 [Cadophora sp. DSE1049]